MNCTKKVEASRLTNELSIPSLRASFSWTLAGNVVYSACQWGMISVLAKLGNAAIVGRFALGLAITAPVFMFTNLQLRGVQATDARSEFEFSDYFSLRLLASLIGLLAVFCIILVARYDFESKVVVMLIGVSKAVESLSDVIAGLLQKAERLDRVAISLMIRGPLSLFAFTVTFWHFHTLATPLAVLIVVWLSVCIVYDLRQAGMLVQGKKRFLAFRWSRMGTLVKTSIPLGFVMTMISLNVNIPRYILEHKLGPADLGIFASLAYLLVVINLIVNALGQAVTSRLSRMFAERDFRRFVNTLRKLLIAGVLGLFFGVPMSQLLGRSILTFIYRPEYGSHVSLFVIMVTTAGVSSMASFLGYGMTAARSFRMQVPVIGASTLTTIAASLVLIPYIGSKGAAYALLIGACVLVIGSALGLCSVIYRQERA